MTFVHGDDVLKSIQYAHQHVIPATASARSRIKEKMLFLCTIPDFLHDTQNCFPFISEFTVDGAIAPSLTDFWTLTIRRYHPDGTNGTDIATLDFTDAVTKFTTVVIPAPASAPAALDDPLIHGHRLTYRVDRTGNPATKFPGGLFTLTMTPLFEDTIGTNRCSSWE